MEYSGWIVRHIKPSIKMGDRVFVVAEKIGTGEEYTVLVNKFRLSDVEFVRDELNKVWNRKRSSEWAEIEVGDMI